MEKLDIKDTQTLNIVDENIRQLKEIFPEVFREDKVDFDRLQELLGNYVNDSEENYNFTWHGKRRAARLAQTPSTGTLRPCKEESVDFDKTQNLFIEGDNLEVLKLLQKSYHRKVKMIYIDPPYNTGNDFVYEDDFKDGVKHYLEVTNQIDSEGKKLGTNSSSAGRYHTNWLNMMYPRLKLARNLLRDDGLIFISIDDNEQDNLKKICNDIFGEENFVDQMIWKKRYGGGAKEKHLVTLHEYILVYAKSICTLPDLYIPLEKSSIDRYYKLKDDNFEIRGPYRTHPLEATKSMGDRKNLVFPILAPDGSEILPKRQWLWSRERAKESLEKGEIEFIKSKDGSWSAHSKQYLRDEDGKMREGKAFSIVENIYSQHGTNEIIDLFGDAQVFSFPKPTQLINCLVDVACSNSEDMVLDLFAGSSSVAHSIFKYNQKKEKNLKIISVQIPELTEKGSVAYGAGYKNIAEISKERIRRAAKKIKEENPDYKGDLGFKVLKLDTSNIKTWEAGFDSLKEDLFNAVDYIKQDRSKEDILYELLLKYGLDLTAPIETKNIAGKTVYSVGLGALIVCLESDISADVVNGIVELKEQLKPEVTRVVFKDNGFKDDVVKTNTLQILKRAGIEDVKSL
jgi:adenine-specific DNA-methyltransferase